MKVSFPGPATGSVLIAALFFLKVSVAPAQTTTRILPSPPPARQAKIATAVLTDNVSYFSGSDLPPTSYRIPDGMVLWAQPLFQVGNSIVWDSQFVT